MIHKLRKTFYCLKIILNVISFKLLVEFCLIEEGKWVVHGDGTTKGCAVNYSQHYVLMNCEQNEEGEERLSCFANVRQISRLILTRVFPLVAILCVPSVRIRLYRERIRLKPNYISKPKSKLKSKPKFNFEPEYNFEG